MRIDQAKKSLLHVGAITPLTELVKARVLSLGWCYTYCALSENLDDLEATIDKIMEDAAPVCPGYLLNALPSSSGLPQSLLADMTLSEWHGFLEHEFTQQFIVCKEMVYEWIAHKIPGGMIHLLPMPEVIPNLIDSVSEHAWHAFSRSIAKEYGRKKITSNLLVYNETIADIDRVVESIVFLMSSDASLIDAEHFKMIE